MVDAPLQSAQCRWTDVGQQVHRKAVRLCAQAALQQLPVVYPGNLVVLCCSHQGAGMYCTYVSRSGRALWQDMPVAQVTQRKPEACR